MENIINGLQLVVELINNGTLNAIVIEKLEEISFAIECELPHEEECLLLVDRALQLLDTKKAHGNKLDIDCNEIQNMLEMGFNVTKIALHFNVCKRVIFQRMKSAGLSVKSTYTEISEEALHSVLLDILLEFPDTGYKRMTGFLKWRGIRVTERRLRRAMQIVDAEGVESRKSGSSAIRRRVYQVNYSNQIWHIDANLKLIRWGIVIRGGIDGKSRKLMYLEASNNNRSDTHMTAFLKGVREYGLPIRTRSDKGGENIDIARFMLEHRGLNKASHICGKSVHNQRIERFWRDLFEGCLKMFYYLFYRLEQENVLNVDNAFQMTLLQHIFIPRLNVKLQEFTASWNNHPISTENNMTPDQIFFITFHPPQYDMALSEEEIDDQQFLCNYLSDLERFDSDNFCDPCPPNNITENQHQFISSINPLKPSNSNGYDIYKDAFSTFYNSVNQP